MLRIEKRKYLLRFPVLFILLLAACSGTKPDQPTAATIETEAVPTESEFEAAEVGDTVTSTLRSTAVPQPTGTTAPDPTEASAEPTSEQIITIVKNEEGILIGDNRSNQLRSLTDSWNTDWERHTIDYDEILSGGPPRDGIPSIDAPTFDSQDVAGIWLASNEPVIAVEIDGEARAYPLQILTWHEIVNDTINDVPIIVTFCPLCNSALVFDRRFEGQVFEFGTSGLLRNSDLIMYDRTTETLWQQFTGEGIVGELAGEQLTFLPSTLVSFKDFSEAYPEGVVLSQNTGFNRAYGRNPYAGYDSIDQPFLFAGELDGRLPAMARVVTVSLADVGVDVAYLVSDLAEVGVINDNQGGQDLVVFYTPGTSSALGAEMISIAEDVGATAVYDPTLNGQKLTFTQANENIIDAETGSSWNILGQAIGGPLAGETLTPIIHGDHFWFSWAAFKPDTSIYQSQ